MGDVSDEALLKEFLLEVSEVGRDNEVNRYHIRKRPRP